MLHTTDLMLGNWVEYATGLHKDKRSIPMQVMGLFSDTVYLNFEGNEGDVFEEEEENLLGIPLTEEIMENIGVVKSVPECMESKDGTLMYAGKSNDDFAFSFDCMPCFSVKYLHQLQNAYFMLTGKQLEVKL